MAAELPQDDLINFRQKLDEESILAGFIINCTFLYLMNLDFHKVENCIMFSIIFFLSATLFSLALKNALHIISRGTLNIGMLHQPPHLIDFEDLLKEGSHFSANLTLCSFLHLIMLLQSSYLMNLDFNKNVEKCIMFSIICFLSTTLFSFALKKFLHFISRCTLYIGMLLCVVTSVSGLCFLGAGIFYSWYVIVQPS